MDIWSNNNNLLQKNLMNNKMIVCVFWKFIEERYALSTRTCIKITTSLQLYFEHWTMVRQRM